MSDGPAQERAARRGADLFLTKPFSPLRLLRLVDELAASSVAWQARPDSATLPSRT